MKKNILFKFSGSFFLLFSAMAVKAKEPPLLPEIHEVSIQDSNVEKYGKFEAAISLSATFANPYDYSQVAVSATFTSPSGRVVAVDGFYMQDYVLNTVAGSLSPSGQGGFRVRFSPDETGTWHFTASVVRLSAPIFESPATVRPLMTIWNLKVR